MKFCRTKLNIVARNLYSNFSSIHPEIVLVTDTSIPNKIHIFITKKVGEYSLIYIVLLIVTIQLKKQ